jgi:O-antigen ligase
MQALHTLYSRCNQRQIFICLFALFLPFLLLGIWKDKLWVMAIPMLIGSFFLLIYRYRILYWILIASIPLSVTKDFNQRLSTDFPTEFICIILAGIFWVLWVVYKPKAFHFLWNHKLIWVLFTVWIWSAVSSFSAVNSLIATKYVLAKIWYISSFLFFTFWIIETKEDIKKLFWALFIPIMLTAIFSFYNTAVGGFSFENTNKYSLPFYDNHVIYATTMTLILPFVFIARRWYKKGTLVRLFLTFSMPFLLAAIYFSYTRACYLALIVGIGMLVILRFKKLVFTYSLVVILVTSILFYLARDYSYLRLAPDYNTTVMHNEFKDHLISTFYGKDASSMERLNMWVSVFRMYREKPILGYGPNNFSSCYKPYSVMYFKTWVSDNPLNLSCHNYFWLLLAEQGVFGVILFVIFIGLILYYIQKIYKETKDKDLKSMVQMMAVCMGIYLVILFFNDLIETSKNGSLFFIIIALLIRIHMLSNTTKNELNP